ncbi:hypothetical protein GCM10011344_46770 [Dokdonia pacifica]|uniref:Por secretion system C-terminal sorting domain-containing protein n=1 Tax=Dokdonia pacifica TaxID=1627892 RepID=A0A239D760_9FLAO|nr:T9SS type A sorting domain-containing protein [Dokdonia pacifica]GGG40556.1 hypothetical protein GCM10011344_46770 [Dokdonia pacifica]SNS28109.1 Por secretion system C-terminal sorting domain-containing protein [Dokdonia pacifica]
MKKTTYLLAFLSISAFAQETAYGPDTIPSTTTNNVTEGTITRVDNGTRAVIDSFTTLADFNDALGDCNDATLTSEDFSNGPGGITNCGETISSDGDGCFAAGEIETGFNVTSSEIANPAAVVSIPAGSLGNADPLVGAFTFAEFTIISFDNGPTAIAFDLWENNDPTTTIRIYNDADELIETFMANTPTNTQTFFGFYANEPISRVELEGNNDSGELFGNFLFGADCSNLGIEDQILSEISVFPNPTTNFITLNIPSNISVQKMSLIDITGKNTQLSITDNTLNMSNLANGVYILKVETSAGIAVRKVIKQ